MDNARGDEGRKSAESQLGVNVMGNPILLFTNIFDAFISGFVPFGGVDETDPITYTLSAVVSLFRFFIGVG